MALYACAMREASQFLKISYTFNQIGFHSYTATTNEKPAHSIQNENQLVFHISEDDSEIVFQILGQYLHTDNRYWNTLELRHNYIY